MSNPSHDADPADFNSYGSDSDDTQTKVIKLNDFEGLPGIAAAISDVNGLDSVLYRYKDSYYLELVFYMSENTPELVKDNLALAYEYGDQTSITSEVLREHGKTIIDSAALELAKHYFKA